MAAAAPHVMVVPLPEQGHVTPLMELSHRLVEHGVEVTFVCTERTHALVADGHRDTGIRLVSMPDGLADGDDRKDIGKFLAAFSRSVPVHLEEPIRAAGVKWLVVDSTIAGLCSDVARKLAVRVACFYPASAAFLGTLLRMPQLMEDGFFDDKGRPTRHGAFELAPGMPPLYTVHMPWSAAPSPEVQHAFFQLVSRNTQATRLADIILCNSFLDAEAAALQQHPGVLPVGPLFADRKPAGHFLPEDEECLRWLDSHADGSVVYVAFGTSTVFGARQFRELAEGLELAGRPFLWAARPYLAAGGLSAAWLDAFRGRVAGRGMVVGWCAQQKVLAHRAVACFVSHCGWNSTMDGVRNGVPILCWPYFIDQFTDRSYVCDIWRTGLAVSPGEDGVVPKEEVSAKVEQLIADRGIAERARVLRDAAHRSIAPGGTSYDNFRRFANLIKE